MDFEKIIEKLIKIYIKNPLAQLDCTIIKKTKKTKIENIEEYLTLHLLVTYYQVFFRYYYIKVLNQEENAKDLISVLENIFYLDKVTKDEIVNKWFLECDGLKNEVINDLNYFLTHLEEKEIYQNA